MSGEVGGDFELNTIERASGSCAGGVYGIDDRGSDILGGGYLLDDNCGHILLKIED